MSAEALPPGGEAEIKTTLHTKGRAGPMKKTVTVYSNDPETPQLVLTMSGETWVDVAAEPARLAFNELRIDEKATQTLTLSITDPDAVAIKEVTLADERFRIVPLPGDERGKKRYEVTYLGAKELARVSDQVRVAYTGPDGEQQVSVPIWAQIVGDLRYPVSVFFGKKDGVYESRKVTLSTRSGKPVRILGATDADGRLDVKILKAHGPTVELEATVKDASLKAAQGRIEITTSDRLEPKVRVAYSLHDGSRRPSRPALRRPLLKRPIAGRGAPHGDARK